MIHTSSGMIYSKGTSTKIRNTIKFQRQSSNNQQQHTAALKQNRIGRKSRLNSRNSPCEPPPHTHTPHLPVSTALQRIIKYVLRRRLDN